jgi:hypothetical protein
LDIEEGGGTEEWWTAQRRGLQAPSESELWEDFSNFGGKIQKIKIRPIRGRIKKSIK